MEQFVMGAIAMASTMAALFFLRFWRDTGDRLFAMFALAFLLLGITRFGLAMSHEAPAVEAAAVADESAQDAAPPEEPDAEQTPEVDESKTHWYWVRFAAFLLILIAIADKNRR
jgi:uncharacterized membrane protein HdeD (DUF308 family)